MTGEALVTDERLDRDRRGTEAILVEKIEAARRGDGAAFEEIMILTERRVARIAWRILGDAEDVQDALQETFLRFFRHLDRYDGRRDPMGWLSRIAVNASLDVHRRRKRIRGFDPLDESAPVADAALAADDALIRDADLSLLRRAIDALPTKQRLAVLLRDVEGLTTDEVAASLGTSVSTVRVHLSRARVALRRLVEQWRGGTR